jgi:hypothetical protein
VPQATGGTDAIENPTIEAQHIPVDMAGSRYATVPKPVDLGDLEAFLIEFCDEYPSAVLTGVAVFRR